MDEAGGEAEGEAEGGGVDGLADGDALSSEVLSGSVGSVRAGGSGSDGQTGV